MMVKLYVTDQLFFSNAVDYIYYITITYYQLLKLYSYHIQCTITVHRDGNLPRRPQEGSA